MLEEDIPDQVKEQLERAGIKHTKMMPRGLLHDIVNACKDDFKLIENENAVTLAEQIKPKPKQRKSRNDYESYEAMIKAERDNKQVEQEELTYLPSFI